MKKVIIQYQGTLKLDEQSRLEEGIRKDIARDGFVLLDDRFKVIEFDDGKED